MIFFSIEFETSSKMLAVEREEERETVQWIYVKGRFYAWGLHQIIILAELTLEDLNLILSSFVDS